MVGLMAFIASRIAAIASIILDILSDVFIIMDILSDLLIISNKNYLIVSVAIQL